MERFQCINFTICGSEAESYKECLRCLEKHFLCSECNSCKEPDKRPGRKRDPEKKDEDAPEEFESRQKKTKSSTAKLFRSGPARSVANTHVQPSQQELTLLHLDVGQGACTLVLYTYPDGRHWTAVIDGGHGNPGRGQIVRYLKALERTEIDALFLSHYDADHADGLADLICHHADQFSGKTTKLYLPYVNKTHPICGFAEKFDVPYCECPLSNVFEDTDSSIHFRIERRTGSITKDENGRSMVLLITLGKFKYLTCGDLPTDQGEDNVYGNPVDVLFCSHHGSAHSTSEPMLKKLQPAIAVISAGRNSYGHPNSETIARFPRNRKEFRLYLTGCQYNRKYINPEYYKTENTNLCAMLDETRKQFESRDSEEESKNLAAALIDGLEFCVEEKHEAIQATKQKERVSKWLQGQLDSTNKRPCTIDKEVEVVKTWISDATPDKEEPPIGVVSGSGNGMGAVGIRIPPPPADTYVDVGFCDQDGIWEWRDRWDRRPNRLILSRDKINDRGKCVAISGAIKDGTQEIPGSPQTFRKWHGVRVSERKPFSLSTRTPRQPALMVKYKCRLCGKSRGLEGPSSTDMILVACERCRFQGWIVAYHEKCFKRLINGEVERQNEHPLSFMIQNVILQRESPSDVVLISAEFEACYFCRTFGNGESWQRMDKSKEPIKAITSRRKEYGEVALDVGTEGFAPNATFGDFYKDRALVE